MINNDLKLKLIEYNKPIELKLIGYNPFNATQAFLNGLINQIEYKQAILEYKKNNGIAMRSAINHKFDIYV